jgi:fructose-1-phosphate kinase PfkB-like protein
VVVDAAGDSVLVYERPADGTEEEFERFLRLLEERLLPLSARAIVAGSIPRGAAVRGHVAIVEACRRAGVPLLVDASGAGLRDALGARPDVVKIGREEALEAGLVDDAASSTDADTALVDAGARLAVVTDGPREVVAADAHMTWHSSVPRVQAVNPVGSGDSFNAAMSLALMAGADVPTALRKGVAAGTANALTLSGASLDPAVAGALEDDVHVTAVTR